MTPDQFIKMVWQEYEKYLIEEIDKFKKQTLQDMIKFLARPDDDEFFPSKTHPYFTFKWFKEERLRGLDRLERLLAKIRGDLKFIGKKIKKGMITPEMIERAKNYPIGQLLEINKQGFTKCFRHNDKHPSAYCKKNFAFCFVCDKSWDSIQILVERDGLTFKDAVLKLQ